MSTGVPGCTGPIPGERAGHVEVTAVEGTAAADLAAAIRLVPAGMVLVDFAADADVCLVFGPPASHGYPPGVPAGQGTGPHPPSLWEDGWNSAA